MSATKKTQQAEHSHHGRITESRQEIEPSSPRWWGPTIGALAGAGAVIVLVSYAVGSPKPLAIVAALGCWAASLMMAMRWH